MYIYPNTDLYILRNVSLNNDYDHTIYFGSELAQRNFFSNNLRVKWILNNQSYQRKERGYIQINLNQNDLWDCTYLMYRNTAYKNKWFYAFILSVDYVNDGVSRINFEIDVIQTWMFDYQLDKCFVEREHTTTDELFENTVPESLDIGNEYHVQVTDKYNLDCSLLAIVLTSNFVVHGDEQKLEAFNARRIGEYFTGVGYWTYDLNSQADQGALKTWLKNYIDDGAEDGIITMYQYPRFMGLMTRSDESFDNNEGYASVDKTIYPNYVQVDGYIPKNKKLFTYPYNLIEVSDGFGHVSIIKNELWGSGNRGKFKIIGSQLGIPSALCYPYDYGGETHSIEHGLTMRFNLTNPFSGDAYQVWLARNIKNYDLEESVNAGVIIGGAALTALGSATANPLLMTSGIGTAVSGFRSLIGNITSEMKAKNELEATPKPYKGQIANEVLNIQGNNNGYFFKQKTIRQEYAKIVDEYFSRFGYACHRIKVPNRNARVNWTYTKTIGCEIVGNLPSDDAVKIKAIYDHGITFWNDGLNVGYYGDFTNPVYS